MELQVGVKALIKNKSGKYLVVRSSPVKYPEKDGTWDIVGGRIILGTMLDENLKREVYEETKITINPRPQLIAAQDILKTPDKHVVRLTYLAECKDTDVVLNEEGTQYQWLDFKELTTLPNIDPYLKEVLGMVT